MCMELVKGSSLYISVGHAIFGDAVFFERWSFISPTALAMNGYVHDVDIYTYIYIYM